VLFTGYPDENRALTTIPNVNRGILTVIASNGRQDDALQLIAGTITPAKGATSLRDTTRHENAELPQAHYIGRIFQNPLLGTRGKIASRNTGVMPPQGYKVSGSPERKLAYFRNAGELTGT
jgi:putative ABC transport system ATP-binding protein